MRNKKRKDGRYRSAVYLGKVDGKPKYKYFYSEKLGEAEDLAREYKKSLSKGLDLDNSLTFSQAVELLLSDRKATMSENEYNTLESRLYVFSLSLGNIKLREIRKTQIQPILNDLAVCNPMTNKPSAQRTVNRYLAACSAVFENAIENRLIEFNPCKYVQAPKGLEKHERRALTMDEIRRIEETPHRAQLPCLLMIYAGLRKGEAAALEWTDIDLDEKTITVNKSYDYKNGRLKTPKTKSGIRVIAIPDRLVEYLRKEPHTSKYVVHTADNRRMTLNGWKVLLDSYLLALSDKYGDGEALPLHAPVHHEIYIQPFTLHELRHTFATLMYLAGVDILTAKEQLGHSDVRTTLDIYSHLDKQYKKKNISKLDDLLN